MDSKNFLYVNPASRPSEGSGPLAGLRLAIQPSLAVRDWPTQAASKALENYTALEDATAVERMRAAGAWIVGSTKMSELGMGLTGDTAAAALAAGHCDAALVADTWGEARHAAARAEVYGFKPSWGVVSRRGLVGLIPSMETLGAIARDPDALAKLLACLAGPDPGDFSLRPTMPDFAAAATEAKAGGTGANAGGGSASDPNAAREIKTVAVLREALAAMPPEEADAFRQGLARLTEGLGLAVREIDLPDYALFRMVHQVIGAVEASSSAGKYDGVRFGHRTPKADNWNEMYLKTRAESFGTRMKTFLFQGAYFQFKEYDAFENACRVRRRLVEALRAIFGEADAIAMPTRRAGADATRAATVGEVYEAFAPTLPANVAGLPAVTLPGLVTVGGLDLGLQLMGRELDDAALLRLATRWVSTQKGAR